MPCRAARSLPAAAREEKRRLATRLRQEAHTFAAIGAIVVVNWATVHGWRKRVEAGGLGTQRRLTPRQARTLRRLVADQTPGQLRMPLALWTRAARLTSGRAPVPHCATLQHCSTRSRYPRDRSPSITNYRESSPVR